MNFWDEKEAKRLFQQFPFYNVLNDKPNIKHLSNIVLLHELPFYDELNIVEISKAFKGYTRSYKIEIVDLKDPLTRLKASKSSIKDLFKDSLHEMKSLGYQVTVTVLLSRYKENGDKEFVPVYFNSANKTVISSEYMFDKSFQ